MQSKTLLALITIISFSGAWASAQVASPRAGPASGDWKSAIEKKIESDYPLTQATADKADIVTAGAVLVLKMNFLVMHSAASPLTNANTYKGGKISAGFVGSLCKNAKDGSCRTFVKGEKFWLLQVDVKDDGLALQFMSDPLPDMRYLGSLKFPFAKGTQPTPDEMAAVVAEVIGTDAAAPAQPSAAQAPAAPEAAAAPVEQAPAPIAPPPPPADQPAAPAPEIALGQSKDQVIAAFGQPQKIVTLGTKQILYFKELKVTLVGGKVTDVQ